MNKCHNKVNNIFSFSLADNLSNKLSEPMRTYISPLNSQTRPTLHNCASPSSSANELTIFDTNQMHLLFVFFNFCCVFEISPSLVDKHVNICMFWSRLNNLSLYTISVTRFSISFFFNFYVDLTSTRHARWLRVCANKVL